MCVPSRYLDFSGAISSSLHRTQFIPKVERRLDTIVAMVASSMPIPDRTNLSTIQIGGESFSLVQDNFYTALHQRRGGASSRQCGTALQSEKAATCVLAVVGSGCDVCAYPVKQRNQKRIRSIFPGPAIYPKLWRLVAETQSKGLPIDVRCTDTDTTPNSVVLVGSTGDLYTEGYAHSGKVPLYKVSEARPDRIRALWPHLDHFGHARRYLNWNP